MTPATPMFATLALATPLEVAAAAPVAVPLREVPVVEVAGLVDDAEVAGLEAAGVVAAGVVAAPLLLTVLALTDEEPATLLEPLPVTQAEEAPGLIVNAADCAMAPVLSRRVSPMEVPAAMLAVHVREVPVCWPRSWRAGEPGELPGRMLKK